MILIRKARYDKNRERGYMLLIHVAEVLDAAVFLLSLSYLSSQFKLAVLIKLG